MRDRDDYNTFKEFLIVKIVGISERMCDNSLIKGLRGKNKQDFLLNSKLKVIAHYLWSNVISLLIKELFYKVNFSNVFVVYNYLFFQSHNIIISNNTDSWQVVISETID